jgi:hypothetical protein
MLNHVGDVLLVDLLTAEQFVDGILEGIALFEVVLDTGVEVGLEGGPKFGRESESG